MPEYRSDLANCHDNLAEIMETLDRPAEAEQANRGPSRWQEKLTARLTLRA